MILLQVFRHLKDKTSHANILRYLNHVNIGILHENNIKFSSTYVSSHKLCYFALNLQACYSFFGNVVGPYKDFWTSYTFNIISKFRRWGWHSGWAEVCKLTEKLVPCPKILDMKSSMVPAPKYQWEAAVAKYNHASHQLSLSNAGCNVAHGALTICKRFSKFCIRWLCNSLPFPYLCSIILSFTATANHFFLLMFLDLFLCFVGTGGVVNQHNLLKN